MSKTKHAHEARLAEWKRKVKPRHRPAQEVCPHWDYENEYPDCVCPCTSRCTGETCRA